ncbi:NAD-binding protein [Peptoniphilus porci]|uniref:Trk system potassium uptake protein TrkA n=1 Tax=Peptoniphilus porci TaxID=2652280 RepID=A0A1U7M0V5_9FIRM|nr:NAD-binding protein [Peptoniphilus porci]OLR65238.1 TrkA [Peptoniphilus porci]
MKILIIGSGKVGSTIANTLSLEKFEIDVVDRDELNFEKITNTVTKIKGDVLDEDFVLTMDLESYDYAIIATDSDKTNLIMASIFKDLSVKIILRLDEMENISEIGIIKNSLPNIVNIFNRSLECAKLATKLIGSSNYYEADYFGKGKIEVTGHYIDMDEEFENLKIKEIGSLSTILVVGILREGDLIVPDGETILKSGDYMYLMGLSRDIRNFKYSHFEIKEKEEVRDVVIASGDMTFNRIIANLENVNLKIIEPNREKFEDFRKKLNRAFVVNKNLKNDKIFKEENISKDAVFISMTDSDELNIVLGLMARNHGISRNVIIQRDNNYDNILESLGIYRVIDPKVIVANEIIKSINTDMKVSINYMFGGKAQVYEIKIPDDFIYIGKKLSEINLHREIIIGGIIRYDNSAVIPRGNTRIEKGDRLVIFSTNESRKELEELIDPTLKKSIFDFFRR